MGVKNLYKIFFFIILSIFFNFININESFCLEKDDRYSLVYEKISPSIVSIEANLDIGVSSGTGCIISENGIILTSLHVINKANDIEVITSSGKIYKAKVLGVLKNKKLG